jgi:kynureninase
MWCAIPPDAWQSVCAERDAADPLAHVRARFVLPPGEVYLAGHSLGPLVAGVSERIAHVIAREWGERGVRSFSEHGWIDAPARIGAQLARLLGAASDEVVVCDSTSVNLFKLLSAALALRPGRARIVTELATFPSDLYVAEGVASLSGGAHRVCAVPRDALDAAIDTDTAVLLLTHVEYQTGALRDLASLSRRARDVGAISLWDLSHSAGVVPLDLHAAGVDLAVGCTYKYLCGGPGAPAYAYVRRDLAASLRSPLRGWLGHASPFAFEPSFRPAAGASALVCGTPPILSMLALEASLAALADVDVARVREKSVALSDLLIAYVEQRAPDPSLELASPRDADARGSQVSFRHPGALALSRALAARGVIADFRTPDLLRLGLAPLALRFTDVLCAARTLCDVLESQTWDRETYRGDVRVT